MKISLKVKKFPFIEEFQKAVAFHKCDIKTDEEFIYIDCNENQVKCMELTLITYLYSHSQEAPDWTEEYVIEKHM